MMVIAHPKGHKPTMVGSTLRLRSSADQHGVGKERQLKEGEERQLKGKRDRRNGKIHSQED
jgi:hypothetical protein